MSEIQESIRQDIFPERSMSRRGTLEFNIWGKIPDQNAKDLCLLQDSRSLDLATKTLNDLGYKNAVLMDAQFEDWIKAGYPVER